MISKIIILFSFVLPFFVKSVGKICMTPDQFKTNRPVLFTADMLKGIEKTSYLPHKFIFHNARLVGRGGFGQVRVVNDKVSKVAIKLIRLTKELDRTFLIREIEMLRRICDQREDKFSKFAECNSRVIAPFYGCVEDGNSFYLFVRIMSQDLSSEIIKNKYHGMTPFERAKAMLHIIDKFVELHRLDIIHGDIKPSNIMTKVEDIAQFRIIDLGLANYKGQDYFGGTHGYLPPERYRQTKYGTGLMPTDDVFALAMTFAELEGDFDTAHLKIKNKCFETNDIERRCQGVINDGLDYAYAKKKGLQPIRKIIEEALAIDPSKRIQTMEDFSRAIIGTLGSFDGAREYIADMIASGESYDKNSSLPSFWKHSLVSTNDLLIRMRNRKQNLQPKKEEKVEEEQSILSSFFQSLGKALGCAEDRKEEKTKAKTYALPTYGKGLQAYGNYDQATSTASRFKVIL